MTQRPSATLRLLLVLGLACAAFAQDATAPAAPPRHAGRTAAEWTETLAAADVSERQTAVYALYQLADSAPAATITALAKCVGDDDEYVRNVAGKSLAKAGDRAAPVIPALAALLADEREGVRREAVTLLFRFGARSATVAPQLKAALESEDFVVRANAAATLGACGDVGRGAMEQLEQAAADENEQVRTQAAGAIATLEPLASFGHAQAAVRRAAAIGQAKFGKKSDAVLDALLAALGDEDELVRSWSASALATAFITVDAERKASALPQLASVLANDTSEGARSGVAWTLGRYRDEPDGAVPPLLKAAKEDAARAVRTACIQSLGWLGAAARDDVLPVLLNGMAEDDALMRQMCVVAFSGGKDCSERVMRALRGALADPDRMVRRAAATALGARGEAAGTAVPWLIACYEKNDDVTTRAGVLGALAMMGKPAKEAAGPLLTSALGEDRLRMRAAYALCMLHAPDEHAALDVLIEGARDPDSAFLVSQYFAQLGAAAKRAVPVLVESLEGKGASSPIDAAVYLGRMGPAAAAAAPALERAAAGDDAELARTATDALEKIRQPALTGDR